MSLLNRIKKLEAIRNKPLTQQEISDVLDWCETEWFPHDKEAELLFDKVCQRKEAESPNTTTDENEEILWRQFNDRGGAHIKKLGDKCPLLVRRALL